MALIKLNSNSFSNWTTAIPDDSVTTAKIADDSIQSLKNRNLIINGAMQVAQRGTQVTGVTTPGYRTCDRFYHSVSNLGTWTVDQSTDAPNGFSNSFKLTCTTADASPAAADWCFLFHRIEAQNLQHLAFGTADAKSMTLSFWVKSNKTGAASLDLLQFDNSTKMVSKSYTINSADTWEYKTISIPADTAGLIDNDNGYGLQIEWWLNSGTDWSSGSLQSTWSTYDATHRNVSNLGVGGAINDYFAITGVQLEVGEVATPFEHESFGQTLAKCQRYYEKSYNQDDAPGTSTQNGLAMTTTVPGNANMACSVFFAVEKRAAPTVLVWSHDGTSNKLSVRNPSAVLSEYSTTQGVPIYSTATRGALLRWSSGSSTGYVSWGYQWTADSEL